MKQKPALCFSHMDRNSVAVCSQCGKPLCKKCMNKFANRVYCAVCLQMVRGTEKEDNRFSVATFTFLLMVMLAIPVGAIALGVHYISQSSVNDTAIDLNNAGEFEYQKGNYLTARKKLEEAVAMVQDDPVIWSNLGFCRQALNDQPGAGDSFRKSLDLEWDEDIAEEYVWTLYHIGDGDTLMSFMEDHEGDRFSHPLSGIYYRGLAWYLKDDFEKAMALIWKVHYANPTEDTAYLLGDCLGAKGEYKQAEEILQPYALSGEGTTDLYRQILFLLRINDENKHLNTALTELVEENLDNIEAHNLFQQYIQLSMDDLLRFYDQMRKKHKDNVLIQYYGFALREDWKKGFALAVRHITEGRLSDVVWKDMSERVMPHNPEMGLSAAEQYLKLHPGDAEMLIFLDDYTKDTRCNHEIQRLVREICLQGDNQTAGAWRLLADACYDDGKEQMAVNYAKTVLNMYKNADDLELVVCCNLIIKDSFLKNDLNTARQFMDRMESLAEERYSFSAMYFLNYNRIFLNMWEGNLSEAERLAAENLKDDNYQDKFRSGWMLMAIHLASGLKEKMAEDVEVCKENSLDALDVPFEYFNSWDDSLLREVDPPRRHYLLGIKALYHNRKDDAQKAFKDCFLNSGQKWLFTRCLAQWFINYLSAQS